MMIQWVLLIACLKANFGVTEALSDDEKSLTVAVVAGVLGAAILITTLVISFYLRIKDSKKVRRAVSPHTYDEKATSF